MNEIYLWTKSKARLQLARANPGKNYNWLFLPGGPGLGSESLRGLIDILNLPGNVWNLDLSGDGSNITENDAEYFAQWRKALIEATSALPNVILVAHSSGGMFALSTPALEKNIIGLVLMGSAPNTSWQAHFAEYVKEHPLPETEKLQTLYEKIPSNETLKKLTITSAPYISTNSSFQQIVSLLEHLPFNYKTHSWAEKNFHDTYQAKWIPKALPTLIFSGDQDHITPLKLFTEEESFKRNNILIQEIKDASHFPWYDNPTQIKKIFEKFCQNYQ